MKFHMDDARQDKVAMATIAMHSRGAIPSRLALSYRVFRSPSMRVAGRGRRCIERQWVEARLPMGKTLDTFDFKAVPARRKS
jgi:hypothetical protein